MGHRGPLPPLIGRQRECDELDRLVARVRSGRSGALVVSGEAGVGKSALLDHLSTNATGCHVVRATGVESEMELTLAGLHQACAPFLDRIERIPDPQARALRIVFGLEEGDVPDRFVVGLATLSLLAEAARERPVVCMVDDAQWLDRPSLQVLAFVARRLVADSVALVFAVRDASTEPELASLPGIMVEGLRDADARALLRVVVAGLVDEQVRDRIVAETRGNPLALVELTRGLGAAQLAGGIGTTDGRAVPGRVEARFLRRLEALPPDARRLLVLAAAEPSGDPILLWRAAERLGISATTADEVQTDGLLTIGARVVFRHPLARSAAYRSAPAAERRAVHVALGEVTDRDVDPDRWAWHLAAATPGPDDAVARELERCAERAEARGGLAAGAAFQRRAVAVTRDPALRAARALRAAQASLAAGDFDATHDLLTVAGAGPLSDLQRAQVDLVRADAAFSRSRGGDGPTLLLRAAAALEPLDPVLARRTYLDAWSAALFAGSMAAPGAGQEDVAHRALAAPAPTHLTAPFDLLLQGFALAMTRGRRAAVPVLERCAAAFVGNDASLEEVLRWGWLATAAAAMVWDYDACLAISSQGVRVARDNGALTVLAVSLNVHAQAVCLGGDLGAAAILVNEAAAVTDATGSQVAAYGGLVLAGMRGREDEALELVDATVRQASAWGQGTAVQYARWATAILYNGSGRHEDALRAAQAAAAETRQLFVSPWSASEAVEAAAALGARDAALDALAQLTEVTGAAGTEWARGVGARARALVSHGDAAERLFREAIERLGRTRVRPELARAHLLYGEWLARADRAGEAGPHLRTAHDLFVACRMEAFEARARQGLTESGVRVRDRQADALEGLTSQEAEIARLAADGRSNPEIGAQLFVSPRTVEWHLHKVFLKLGIASRRELSEALVAPGPSFSAPESPSTG